MGVPEVNLVAESTSPDGAFPVQSQKRYGGPPSYFKNLQWSADGTTVFTSSWGRRICTYVLPEDLLASGPGNEGGRSHPRVLHPQGTLVLPEPTSGFAPAPFYSLQQPDTQVLLTASSDHPIQMHGVFPQDVDWSTVSPPSAAKEDDSRGHRSSPSSLSPWPPRKQQNTQQPPPRASFRLIKPENEAYLPVGSILWPSPGTHFYVGTKNLIALFDVTRSDGEPVTRIPTAKASTAAGRLAAAAWGGAVGGKMPGTVSTLAVPTAAAAAGHGGDGYGSGHSYEVENHGLLAAGTWSRFVGLYDVQRSASCAAAWSVAGAVDALAASESVSLAGHDGRKVGSFRGNGIIQTVWSPCARYLIVNERRTCGLLVYDVRGARRLLACLAPRNGMSNQRLECDVFAGSASVSASPADASGFEVWAGSTDGTVAVWEGVGSKEGFVEPSWSWRGHGPDSAVGAAKMHPSGAVLATCSGSWKLAEFEEESSESDTKSSASSDTESLQVENAKEETDLAHIKNPTETEEGREGREEGENGRPQSSSESDDESSSDSLEDSSDSDSNDDDDDDDDESMSAARETRWRQPRPRRVVEETSLRLWSIGPMGDVQVSGEASEPHGEDMVLVVGRTNSQPSQP